MTVVLFGGDESDLSLPVTHYVTKAGNDTTGDGSLALPWLTIHKALTTAPAGAVIGVGAGVYQETSGAGFLDVTRQFASMTYVRSLTGFAGDVVITGLSDAGTNTRVVNATNIRFRNLTFAMRLATNNHCVRLANSTNIQFYTCTFHITSDASVRYGVGIQTSGATTISGAVFSGCTVTQSGTNAAVGMSQFGYTAGSTIDVTIENCFIQTVSDCLYFNGGGYTVRGGWFYSDQVHGMAFGSDTISGGNPTTATVTDVVVRCTAGHGFLFGNAVVSGVLRNSLIYGGDQGVVLKESTGHSVTGCTINAGAGAAIYFKAATNCVATGNRLHADQGTAYAIQYNRGDSAAFNKCQNCTATGNTIYVSESAKVYNVCPNGIASDDTGTTTVINSNNVYLSSTATGEYGTVGASVNITTKANLLTAWGSYGGGTNDNASNFGGSTYA